MAGRGNGVALPVGDTDWGAAAEVVKAAAAAAGEGQLSRAADLWKEAVDILDRERGALLAKATEVKALQRQAEAQLRTAEQVSAWVRSQGAVAQRGAS